MSKLPRLSALELCSIIKRLGFIHTNTSGSHMIFKHPDGRKTTIPNHSGEDIGSGLLIKIIKKDLKITREEFFNLL